MKTDFNIDWQAGTGRVTVHSENDAEQHLLRLAANRLFVAKSHVVAPLSYGGQSPPMSTALSFQIKPREATDLRPVAHEPCIVFRGRRLQVGQFGAASRSEPGIPLRTKAIGFFSLTRIETDGPMLGHFVSIDGPICFAGDDQPRRIIIPSAILVGSDCATSARLLVYRWKSDNDYTIEDYPRL